MPTPSQDAGPHIILGVDTSGKNGSIALARYTPPNLEVLELVSLAGGTYSAQLLPQLSALLARHKLDKHSIDAFAVVSGPGSFTGLRVGLSAIKALAEVLQKPVAAVSMLEALASQAEPGRVLALLDTGRKQVFLGEYECTGLGSAALVDQELLLTHDQLAAAVRDGGSVQVVTPDAPVAALLAQSGLKARVIPWPDAGVIARLGLQKTLRGEAVSPEALDANYIRRSDAEIFAKPGS